MMSATLVLPSFRRLSKGGEVCSGLLAAFATRVVVPRGAQAAPANTAEDEVVQFPALLVTAPLRAIDYRGAIGFQSGGIKAEPRAVFTKTMTAWKEAQ